MAWEVNGSDPAVSLRHHQAPAVPPASGYRTVEFTSDGATLRGRLYLPERRPASVVVSSVRKASGVSALL